MLIYGAASRLLRQRVLSLPQTRAVLLRSSLPAAAYPAAGPSGHLQSRTYATQQAQAEEDTRDAYQVLGVSRAVTEDDLKQTYKELARKWHPDRHQGPARKAAEEKFQLISEAFQVLSDPEKRKAYDEALEVARDGAARAAAARRYRATSWNTQVNDISKRVREAKREEPATLALITGNFILAFYWLAG